MPHLVCITGRARYEEKATGLEWCQECNRYHQKTEASEITQDGELRKELLMIARMLREEELTAGQAATCLIFIAKNRRRTPNLHPRKHD